MGMISCMRSFVYPSPPPDAIIIISHCIDNDIFSHPSCASYCSALAASLSARSFVRTVRFSHLAEMKVRPYA